MYNVLIAGAGKIGSLIACLLAESGNYKVFLADVQFHGRDISRLKTLLPHLQTIEIDVRQPEALKKIIHENHIGAVISSLPYYCNADVVRIAKECNIHYFDLTEDVAVTETVAKFSKDAKTAFVPQCGLAPGFINIAAHSLMQDFDSLDTVKLRVGALPQIPNNALQYALTWSTDGLINEYGNPCQAIESGHAVELQPLEGLEKIFFDGLEYEAFNTSGGLGSLAKTYAGKVKELNYKTIRYPGHCKIMQLLMHDLKLNDDRTTLKNILEKALPKTYDDVVLIYVSVMGIYQGSLIEKNYYQKVYPQKIAGLMWSGIQITTASSLCAIVDLVHKHGKYQGLVRQEQFTLKDILENPFGKYYKSSIGAQ